jgi:hypothetical protein
MLFFLQKGIFMGITLSYNENPSRQAMADASSSHAPPAPGISGFHFLDGKKTAGLFKDLKKSWAGLFGKGRCGPSQGKGRQRMLPLHKRAQAQGHGNGNWPHDHSRDVQPYRPKNRPCTAYQHGSGACPQDQNAG